MTENNIGSRGGITTSWRSSVLRRLKLINQFSIKNIILVLNLTGKLKKKFQICKILELAFR